MSIFNYCTYFAILALLFDAESKSIIGEGTGPVDCELRTSIFEISSAEDGVIFITVCRKM